ATRKNTELNAFGIAVLEPVAIRAPPVFGHNRQSRVRTLASPVASADRLYSILLAGLVEVDDQWAASTQPLNETPVPAPSPTPDPTRSPSGATERARNDGTIRCRHDPATDGQPSDL